MPEMLFSVRWPDGRRREYYSPSLVMHDHLDVGGTYTVTDFRARSTTALSEASERVRAKFGFACTSAAMTTEQIHTDAAAFEDGATVQIVAMRPPLPTAAPVGEVTP